LHNDFRTASELVKIAAEVDMVVGAGDFCICRQGLPEIVDALAGIDKPTVLVPGNSESAEELTSACRNWKNAHVLHGTGVTIEGIPFFGIGGGIPVTPFGSWSYDFTEDEASVLLRDCPVGGVLVSHSPPRGLLDISSDGRHLGSRAVRETVEKKKPALVVCGHIHGSSGQSHRLGESLVINAGPGGIIHDLS
jgi:Icc-related predicted phosphoesterase